MKWIMIANSNECRIYDYQKKLNQLTFIKEINHPENKLKSKDLGTDSPGHYNTSTSARGAFSQPTELNEINFENFARELAECLDEERMNHDFDELVVIMPAHMEGLFLRHLNKNVKILITKTLQKNMMHCSEPELLEYLQEHL
ncbi:TPA: host attachment protein [Legionella pneumophila]|nr:host attachment protein [Legionella pneumophila]HAT8583794.1 host attachment protein [Legionella pneumophila]